jgi:hypothetical protein
MGSNNNKNQTPTDPKGNTQAQIATQTQRFNQQQGPMVNAFAQNYGRGSEANYGDYTDIMNNYRDIASGGSAADYTGGGGGGGGGGGDFSAFTVSPGRAGYSDPFASYGGMQEFANTGGYSADDIANMRARGVSPIRAAYANAQREVGRQRSLQGGYSPNAVAAQVKMAREQGQGMADAVQNVEAGLAEARNKGRQFGLTGMGNIEGQRLGADVDLSKYNTGLDYQGQVYNADAQTRAQAQANAAASSGAASRAAANEANMQDRFRALSGMTSLYGTTPGMSNMFGSQLLSGVGMGGQFGQGMVNATAASNQMPGQFDQTMGRINQIGNLVSQGAGAIYPWLNNNNQNQGGYNPYNPNNQVARPQVNYPMGPVDPGMGGWG